VGAKKVQQEIVDVQTATLGAEHPDTLTAKHELALTVRHLDEGQYAKKLELEILMAELTARGNEHPKTVAAKFNLAMTLLYLGEKPEAKKYLLEVLDVQKRTLPPGDPEMAQTEKVLEELGELVIMAERLKRLEMLAERTNHRYGT